MAMSKNKSNRRRFLKNTSLASLTLAVSNRQRTVSNKENIVTCEKTTLDYYGEGPFYTENPPTIDNNQLVSSSEPGERMIISGRVLNLDCTEYIPNATIDIWHANNNGQYDNIGYNLRGQTKSNAQGFYSFETIKPGKYLNGNVYRPSHIHFKISAPGFEQLTTQLYFAGDPDLDTDPASSINSGQYSAKNRIISLALNDENKLEGTWDIIIDAEGITTATNDIHLDKGIIYNTSPNPFKDQLNIRYGVFKKSTINISVFDSSGRAIATLEEKSVLADQYDAKWLPDPNLPNGIYFIALKINDLQVHYQKVVKS